MEYKLSILAHNIRYLRKAAGLNQEQLAAQLKIKRSNIASYEAKNVEPRLRSILEMAKLFDIKLDSFLRERLDDSVSFARYSDSNEVDHNSTAIDLRGKINSPSFIDKTVKYKKVLQGFKAFYSYRKSRISEMSLSQQKTTLDIDNFIELIDYSLSHHENMIEAAKDVG